MVFLGEDACILSLKDNYFADVIRMNNFKVLQAPIGTGCMKINTLQDPIIGIFNQYVTGRKGHTIHSVLQMEALKMGFLFQEMSFATFCLLAILYLPKSSNLMELHIGGHPCTKESLIRLKMQF